MSLSLEFIANHHFFFHLPVRGSKSTQERNPPQWSLLERSLREERLEDGEWRHVKWQSTVEEVTDEQTNLIYVLTERKATICGSQGITRRLPQIA